jgi:hypothetical protein
MTSNTSKTKYNTSKVKKIAKTLNKLFANSKVTVSISGTTAWTDGKTLNVPVGDFSDPLYSTYMRLYIDHETGHMAHTDFETMPTMIANWGKLGGSVLNAVEDARMEKAQTNDYAGCRINLEAGWDLLIEDEKIKEPMLTDEPLQLIFSYILNYGRYSICGYTNNYVKEGRELISAHLGEGFVDQLSVIIDSVRKAKSTDGSVRASVAIMELIKSKSEEETQDDNEDSSDEGDGDSTSDDKSQDNSDENQSGDNSEDKSNDESDDDDNADGKSQSKSEDDSQDDSDDDGKGSDDAKSDDDLNDDSDGDGKGGSNSNSADDSKEDSKGDGKGESGDDSGDKSEDSQSDSNGDSSSDSGNSSDGSEDDAKGGSSDTSNGDDTDSNSNSDDPDSEGEKENNPGKSGNAKPKNFKSPEDKEKDEAFKEAMKEDFDDVINYDDAIAEALQDLACDAEDVGLPKFDFRFLEEVPQSKSTMPEGWRTLSAKFARTLSKVLIDQSDTLTLPSSHGRRIMQRKLASIPAGCIDVFEFKNPKQAKNSAISVLVDASGSMNDYTMRQANITAIALSKALSRLDIDNEVTYFGVNLGSNIAHNRLYVARKFGGKLDEKRFAVPSHGSTPTSDGVFYSTQRLLGQPSENKIMFIITDGQPDDGSLLKKTAEIAKQCGIKLIPIGLGTTFVRGFEDSVYAKDSEAVNVALREAIKSKLFS